MKKRRLLWILNHDTLSRFELPLIQDLGFEIFTPKIVPKNILERSGSVTYKYDETLTIPDHELELLNQYNFYENEQMPFIIKNIINTHFDVALIMFDFYALKNLIDNFEGQIFARAFGLFENLNYSKITRDFYGESYFYNFEKSKDRIWFSECYDNISKNESGIFEEKAIYMPLGLPEEFYSIENQWIGNVDEILFFCTRINYNKESKEVYKRFIKDFKDFDFIIAGNQPVKVEDKRVTGFLEREELNDLFKTRKVMYYHSTYPRHLHYHPLEAMIAGMPVIYLKGGLLSILGGERQTGCCEDLNEARVKIKRILDGDQELIEMIKRDQSEILYKFSYEFNTKKWTENFLPIVERYEKKQLISKTTAVFLSNVQNESHLLDYIELAEKLNSGIKQLNSNNQIILNLPAGKYTKGRGIVNSLQYVMDTREYSIKEITANEVKESVSLMFRDEPLWFSNYALPVDYAQNYIECDYWLFFFDNIELPIAPIKPYGVLVENIGEKYYGNLSRTVISNLKNAYFILTFSEETKNNLVKYLGIYEENIIVIPSSEIESRYELPNIKSDYVLIEMDATKHNDVKDFLGIIESYYKIGNVEEKISIVLNNCTTELYQELANKIQDSKYVKQQITLFLDVPASEYDILYAHAKIIIIPHNVEGITFKISKAAACSKKIFLNDFLFYKDIVNDENDSIVYEPFLADKYILFNLLEGINSKNEGHKHNDNRKTVSQNKLTEIWRRLV
ncbi:hypothetical protein M3201_14165 [Paenibacillus motobuensis]|uniref:hypothetical protein n=1 Tax=Paenibacillus TaxID=44249 RepID=UPI00203D4B6C|nr:MULTISPECIES: hypothetical protein [Paenibacillus]MCM3040845.1 hypothetical protein [Paenibacillus lutimineralis]MCM3647949.1 hypothetical protein [Paenibacillus motobuensis]